MDFDFGYFDQSHSRTIEGFDGYRERFAPLHPRGADEPSWRTFRFPESSDKVQQGNRQEKSSDRLADSVQTEFQGLAKHRSLGAGLPPLQAANVQLQWATVDWTSKGPFSLRIATEEHPFAEEHYPRGTVTISFPGDDGEIISIQDINQWMFQLQCPLLWAAFEPSATGLKLHLEKLTTSTAIPFLRFLYLGSYACALKDDGEFEDVPTSVLFHSHMFHLGDLYNMPELRTQAYVNVMRQCEFGCSSPDRPIELCAAITFVYEKLRDYHDLIDVLVNYCVSNFLRHELYMDEEFRQLPVEFNRDLRQICLDQNIDNEIACAIIQMPVVQARRDLPAPAARNDVVYHFHATEDDEIFSKKRQPKAPPMRPSDSAKRTSNLALALRQLSKPAADVSESEDDGFEMVRRLSSSPSEECEMLSRGETGVESDASGFVEVKYPSDVLPIRGKQSAALYQSDSEWECV